MSIHCQETVSLPWKAHFLFSFSLSFSHSLSLSLSFSWSTFLFFFFFFTFFKEFNLPSHLACSEINFFVESRNPGFVWVCVCGQGRLKIIPQAAATVVWVCFPIISDNPTRSDTAGRGNVEEPRPDFCSGQHTCSSPSSLMVTVRNKLLWSIFSVLWT